MVIEAEHPLGLCYRFSEETIQTFEKGDGGRAYTMFTKQKKLQLDAIRNPTCIIIE